MTSVITENLFYTIYHDKKLGSIPTVLCYRNPSLYMNHNPHDYDHTPILRSYSMCLNITISQQVRPFIFGAN